MSHQPPHAEFQSAPAPSHAPLAMPSAWVTRFAAQIAPGEVLDLACGSGRHAHFLAGLGLPVMALDRDAAALAQASGNGIETMQWDLEQGATWPFAPGRFTGIVVCNYLHRALFGHILAALAPGGLLIYETFALGNAQFGKPSNPDFLLAPGELLTAFGPAPDRGMQVLAYEDLYVAQPKPAMVQRICSRKALI